MNNDLTILDIRKALDQYLLIAAHSSAKTNRSKKLSYNPFTTEWLLETKDSKYLGQSCVDSSLHSILQKYNDFKV